MLDQFYEAHAAVTEKTALKALHERAAQLTEHALFPIRDSFYVYSDQYQIEPREAIVSPDQASVLHIINDLFLRDPERFGDASNREEIKRRVYIFFQEFADKKQELIDNTWSHPDMFKRLKDEKRAMSADLFHNVADVFKELCPDALKDISIALVGFDSPNYVEEFSGPAKAVFSDKNKALLNMFGKVHDFYPYRAGGPFTLEAIDANHPNTKVDYVVTGNVLNDPIYSLSSHHVFLAAGRMLKQGGRAIHLVGYSNHYYDLHINNPAMVLLAGQKRIASLPTQHHFNGLEEHRYGCQDFVMFEQTRTVDIAPCMVERIIAEGLSARENNPGGLPFVMPYLAPDAPQLPAQLAKLATLANAVPRLETLS